MSGFFYYIPGISNGAAIEIEYLRQNGLGGIFDSGGFSACGVSGGPDGNNGVVVSYGHNPGYQKKTQTWQPIIGACAWVGYETSVKPTPKDLVRDTSLGGHIITLGDGNRWVIPIARYIGGRSGLPCNYGLDDKGQWTVGNVVDRYRKLWDVATKIWDVIRGEFDKSDSPNEEKTVSISFAKEADYAVTALKANYRIDKTEVVILGLFNSEAVGDILRALVDYPALEELAKKKGLDESRAG